MLLLGAVAVAVGQTDPGRAGSDTRASRGQGSPPHAERTASSEALAQRRLKSLRRHRREDNPYAGPLSRTTPARLLPRSSSPLSSSIIWPVLNGWFVGDRRTDTGVWAGAAGNRHSTGRFAILRSDYIRVTQDVDTVDVIGAGPLRIVKAPLGPSVVTWAQKRGNLEFRSQKGVEGTLHLRDDTITLR